MRMRHAGNLPPSSIRSGPMNLSVIPIRSDDSFAVGRDVARIFKAKTLLVFAFGVLCPSVRESDLNAFFVPKGHENLEVHNVFNSHIVASGCQSQNGQIDIV